MATSKKLGKGFIAGFWGAVVLIIVMYVFEWLGWIGEPGFVGIYRSFFKSDSIISQIFAAFLFAVSGGIWGSIYALLSRHSTVIKGAVFGFLPSFWLWIVVLPVIGQPIFSGFTLKGILLPILFNVVIWGSFVGAYMHGSDSVSSDNSLG